MKVMVIGGGGREHALLWKIAQSEQVTQLYCAPGNAGTARLGRNIPLDPTDIARLREVACQEKIDLTVVGPEQPLALGIVDEFRKAGLNIFGPTRAAAELESSKVFAKEVIRLAGVPTPPYFIASTYSEAEEYIMDSQDPLVIKAEGLAAGKGSIVCSSREEALMAARSLMVDKVLGGAGKRIVIEKRIYGEEVSFICLTDGEHLVPLATSQDHKPIFDGDRGPNTGGMGAYSPTPIVDEAMQNQILEGIARPIVQTMARMGRPYQGALYLGLMIDREGPKVLEFNARFGDPETQPLMMRLDTDIVPLLLATITGGLKGEEVSWKSQSSVCVVMASQGYPGPYEKGKRISGLEAAGSLEGIQIFHAGTLNQGDQVLTNGGRVLGVTSLGDDIAQAVERAYQAVRRINWDGVYYRSDIGYRALKRQLTQQGRVKSGDSPSIE